VRDRPIKVSADGEVSFELALANAKSALGSAERQVMFSKQAELVDTSGSTVAQPTLVQAFIMRADLAGFSKSVEDAFSDQSGGSIQRLVAEFLQIMEIPSAFEARMNKPFIRLPWAGDCYNVVFMPSLGEDYARIRGYLPATLSLRWLDPDGSVNATRDSSLASVAKKSRWSLGVSGGDSSNGQMLIANIKTATRSFLVAAGWSVRRSLDCQNADGLAANESALHDEDYPPLDRSYQNAFIKLGTTKFRKATATALMHAETQRLKETVTVQPAPEAAFFIPVRKPYGTSP